MELKNSKILIYALILLSMLALSSNAKAEVVKTSIDNLPNAEVNYDNSLNMIDSSIRTYTSNYKKLPIKYDVSPNKSWSINFGNAIDLKKFSQENVKVINEMGEPLNVTFELGKTNKTLIIKAPREGYKEGKTYALLLLKDRGNGLHNFKESTAACFTIVKSSVDSTTPSASETISISKVEANSSIIWENEVKPTLRVYKPVTLDNLFDKSYIPVYRQKDLSTLKWYGNSIPYHLIDKKAYDNIDVYSLKEMAKDTNQIVITFDKDIDPASVNTETIKLKTNSTIERNFNSDYNYYVNLSLLIDGNKLIINLLDINRHYDGRVFYLLVNGVKLRNSSTIAKPTIMPFMLQQDSQVSILSKSMILAINIPGSVEERIQHNTGLKFTRFEYGFSIVYGNSSETWSGEVCNGFHVAQMAEKEYPDYAPIFKEVNNRIVKYDLLYWDVFESKNAPKKTGSYAGSYIYKDSYVVWDRFTLSGYNVDVLYDGFKVNVVIYEKGTEGYKNPNLINSGTYVPFYKPEYPEFKPIFNFPIEYKFIQE